METKQTAKVNSNAKNYLVKLEIILIIPIYNSSNYLCFNMVYKKDLHIWHLLMMADYKVKLVTQFHKFGWTMSNDRLLFPAL